MDSKNTPHTPTRTTCLDRYCHFGTTAVQVRRKKNNSAKSLDNFAWQPWQYKWILLKNNAAQRLAATVTKLISDALYYAFIQYIISLHQAQVSTYCICMSIMRGNDTYGTTSCLLTVTFLYFLRDHETSDYMFPSLVIAHTIVVNKLAILLYHWTKWNEHGKISIIIKDGGI